MMILRILMMLILSMSPALAQERVDDLLNFSKKQQEGLVVKVVNSNVIVLEDGQRVKLIGTESAGPPPRKYIERDEHGIVIESTQDKEVAIPLEEQAITYAQDLLEGKKVKLEYDVESRSPEGYVYAYVSLADGRMANTELLRMGFVYLKIVPPNLKYADQMRAAYQEAKKEQRGFLGE